MDTILYRLEVIKGKEEIANEWLCFLKNNSQNGIRTLENENVYLESYFKEHVQDQMYIYLFIMCKDIEFANETALRSTDEIDLKHFEYMKACINPEGGKIMNNEVFLDNIKALNR